MESGRVSNSSSELTSSTSSTKLDGSNAKIEEYTFNDWTIRCQSSHILPSQCPTNCSEKEPCILCRYNNELNIPHMPEMVFPYNILELQHKTGCSVQFNALDALKMVNKENISVKIACSETWKKAREDSGLVDKAIVGDFDWTFKTEYNGTYSGWPSRQISGTGIDLEVLKRREKILLYKDLTLFDDELHDNGVAVCTVRIRVMPSGFFVLLRYFLRVDGVILTTYDTRIYHDFTTDYILVESSQREDKVEELQVPLAMMTEPDEVTPLLTLRKSVCEKLILPS